MMPAGLAPDRLRVMEQRGTILASERYWNQQAGGTHLHFCLDWDMMLIDSTDDEFKACGCYDKLEVK